MIDLNRCDKIFDRKLCFQGCENRERLLAIDFQEFCYFRREPLQMEGLLFLFSLVLSFLVIQSNLLLFVILMYTLTNRGRYLLPYFIVYLVPTLCLTLMFVIMLFCIGALFLCQSSWLECLCNFTITWRYFFPFIFISFTCLQPFSFIWFRQCYCHTLLPEQVEYLPIISPRYNGKESSSDFAKRVRFCFSKFIILY